MPLRDTLANMQEQEQKNSEFEKNKPLIIQERQDRIAALMQDISRYLQEYTQDGSVTIAAHDCQIDDLVLGRYNLSTSTITAFGKVVCVDPSGPGRIGFPDSVDIYRQDRSGDNQREVLAWLRDGREPDASYAWHVRAVAPPQPVVAARQVGRTRMGQPMAAQQQPMFERLAKDNFSDLIDRLLR